MRSTSFGISVVAISAVLSTASVASLATDLPPAGEAESRLVGMGPDEDIRFEMLSPEDGAPVMRVRAFGRTDEVPLEPELVQAFESFVEEQGPFLLSAEQVQAFLLTVQDAIDRADSSTPCSPEQYQECYERGVEECEGQVQSGSIGAGVGRLLAPTGVTGLFAGLVGGFIMNRVTCNIPVTIGCNFGCQSGGPGCYPTGSCYEVCPENTQPTRIRCTLNGAPAQCCSWNSPYPGEDTCEPPAICFDDYCLGCPDFTTPGRGHCEANSNVPCGACCIPSASP